MKVSRVGRSVPLRLQFLKPLGLHRDGMITQSPLASAEAMAMLHERYGTEAIVRPESVGIDYADRLDHPVVKPIDAEAVYLNPRVGLCRWDAPVAAILDMLRWHKSR